MLILLLSIELYKENAITYENETITRRNATLLVSVGVSAGLVEVLHTRRVCNLACSCLLQLQTGYSTNFRINLKVVFGFGFD